MRPMYHADVMNLNTVRLIRIRKDDKSEVARFLLAAKIHHKIRYTYPQTTLGALPCLNTTDYYTNRTYCDVHIDEAHVDQMHQKLRHQRGKRNGQRAFFSPTLSVRAGIPSPPSACTKTAK